VLLSSSLGLSVVFLVSADLGAEKTPRVARGVGAGRGPLGPGRAYGISTRTLPDVVLALFMVAPVWALAF
jgi:hypothetical protein